MTVTIVEVIDRSTQGRTEPFICRADDGGIYFVKGHSAGRESQIKEHICGHLAAALGLPVAPFAIVDIPKALIESGGRADLGDLGVGPAFGSLSSGYSSEITYPQLEKVDRRLGRDILVFDWWIKNDDRNLTERGGNPNLLWDQAGDRLVMIDHNLAFNPNFDPVSFAELHVFHGLLGSLPDDLFTRPEYGSRLNKALTQFRSICDSLPEEWLEEAPDWVDLAAIEAALKRHENDDFWAMRR